MFLAPKRRSLRPHGSSGSASTYAAAEPCTDEEDVQWEKGISECCSELCKNTYLVQ